MTAEPAALDASAADRVLRVFARFVGAGYVFYLVLTAPNIVEAARVSAWWWTPVAVALTFGTGIAVGALTFTGRVTHLPRAAGLAAIGYPVALALWVVAWRGETIDSARGLFLSQFNGLASLAAAAAWRPRWAVAHLFACAAGVSTINHAVRSPSVNGPLLPEMAWSIGFCLLPVTAGIMAVRTGLILDRTRASTYEAAADAAATGARSRERARFDALTHDGVMSTLLAAARQDTTAMLAGQAGRTLAALDGMRVTDAQVPLGARATAAHIRAAVNEIDDTTALRTTFDPGAETADYPLDAVRTVAAALAEAVRNSVEHTGPATARTVEMRLRTDGFGAVVTDNGAGFDPAAVPANRLGIAVSILGRLRRLPGGSAGIDSAPGAGTRVRLDWRRP